jgi:hypothetical protein
MIYSETRPRIASEIVVASPRQPLRPIEWRWRNRGPWWKLPDGSKGVWVVSTKFNPERHVAVRVEMRVDQPIIDPAAFGQKLNDARDAETLDQRDAYLDTFIASEVRRMERTQLQADPYVAAREQVVGAVVSEGSDGVEWGDLPEIWSAAPT